MEEIRYSDNQLIETLPNAFARHKIITDADGKPVDYIFLQVNSAFEKLTGLSRKKIIGKRASEVLPDITKDPIDLIRTYAKAALDGESIVFEQYFRSFACWFEVKAYSDGLGYFSTIFDDITEKKKYFEAIQFNNEKMALLLDVSSTIAAKREPHALSKSIVEGMTRLTNMSSAAIYLIQDSKLRLEATFLPFQRISRNHCGLLT